MINKISMGDLRKFAFLVGGFFCLIGFVRHHFLIGLGSALMVLGLVFPRGLKPLYYVWMKLAEMMGWVMTHILLFLLFFIGFTLTRFTAFLFGKKFLALRPDPKVKTYWHYRDVEKIND